MKIAAVCPKCDVDEVMDNPNYNKQSTRTIMLGFEPQTAAESVFLKSGGLNGSGDFRVCKHINAAVAYLFDTELLQAEEEGNNGK